MYTKASLTWLIQNGFIGEAKTGETKKTSFFRLLVHFNSGLQNGFTLQCLNLRKIDKAEADISRAKEALGVGKQTAFLSMRRQSWTCPICFRP